MKTEYLEKRDKALLTVATIVAWVCNIFSLTVVVASVMLDYPEPVTQIIFIYIIAMVWYSICDRHLYCREASLMLLSAVFFFIGCALKAPFWILVKGFYGAGELFICRLRRFLKLEMRRFKKHL